MVYPATVSLFIVAAASTQLFPFTDEADDTYSVVDSISLTVSRLATHGVVQIDARKETRDIDAIPTQQRFLSALFRFLWQCL